MDSGLALRAPRNDALLRRGSRQRIVIENRREPLLGFGDAPVLAQRVILDLIALNLADAEIGSLGMAEIKPAHRSAGPHRKAFGELDAGCLLGAEQREQGC